MFELETWTVCDSCFLFERRRNVLIHLHSSRAAIRTRSITMLDEMRMSGEWVCTRKYSVAALTHRCFYFYLVVVYLWFCGCCCFCCCCSCCCCRVIINLALQQRRNFREKERGRDVRRFYDKNVSVNVVGEFNSLNWYVQKYARTAINVHTLSICFDSATNWRMLIFVRVFNLILLHI